MSDLNIEELDYQRELLQAHLRRLQHLELRQAKFGANAPPEVAMEIEELRQKIAILKAKIGEPETEVELTREGERVKVYRSRVEKNQVAVIVNISRDIQPYVMDFLRGEGIDAEVVVIATPQELKDDKEEWEDFVTELFQQLSTTIQQIGARPIHLFISAPASLAFAVGCMLGTHYRLHLYQWFPTVGSYEKIIEVRRELLFPKPE